MKILIPFSGGLDSTYLVYKTLNEGNIPILVYFDVKNNDLKTKIEKIHRKEIIKAFNRPIEDLKTQLTIEVVGRLNESYTLVQPPIWIMGIHSVSASKYDKIQMAYVLGDCAVSYLKEIKSLYKAYTPFVRNKTNILKPLEFPLIKYAKDEIMNELPSHISKLTWSCENPSLIFEDDNYFIYTNCKDNFKLITCVPCSHNPINIKNYYIYRKKENLSQVEKEENKLTILSKYDFFNYIKKHNYLNKKRDVVLKANEILRQLEENQSMFSSNCKPMEYNEQLFLNLNDHEDELESVEGS